MSSFIQECVSQTSSNGKRSRSPSPIIHYDDLTSLSSGGRLRRLNVKRDLFGSRKARGRGRGRGQLRRDRPPIRSPACPQSTSSCGMRRGQFVGRVSIRRGRPTFIQNDSTEDTNDTESSMEDMVSYIELLYSIK